MAADVMPRLLCAVALLLGASADGPGNRSSRPLTGLLTGSYNHIMGGPVAVDTATNRWISFAAHFTAHMVLQRQLACVWGWCTAAENEAEEELGLRLELWRAGRSARVLTAPSIQLLRDQASDPDTHTGVLAGVAKWHTCFTPPEAVVPVQAYELTLHSSFAQLTLEDILFGDVFLCTGQSNMAGPLVEDWYSRMPMPAAPLLRLLMLRASERQLVPLSDTQPIAKRQKYGPYTHPDLAEGWTSAVSKASFAKFSTLCHAAGHHVLQAHAANHTPVPVGLILATMLGRAIRYFLPWSALHHGPTCTRTTPTESHKNWAWNCYYAPLAGLSLSAVWWYQGESDVPKPDGYACKLEQQIQGWRAQFRSPEAALFVVVVQLHPLPDRNPLKVTLLRQEQHAAAQRLENVALATAYDTCVPIIHPRNKTMTARRVAWATLRHYHSKQPIALGYPLLQSVQLRDDHTVVLSFDPRAPVPRFLLPTMHEAECGKATVFELGADPCGSEWTRVADIQIDGDRREIRLTVPPGGVPRAVRHNQRNFNPCTVYSDAARLLPLLPFAARVGAEAALAPNHCAEK